MRYEFSAVGASEFDRLPPAEQRRIVAKIEYFLARDDPLTGAQALKGRFRGLYRFRIGDYRAIFEVEDEGLVILSVGHRRDVYRR